MKEYRDFFAPILNPEPAKVKGQMKTFDWEKAAQIIKEKNPEEAMAGLAEDWGYTSGAIFRNGEIVPESDTYVYLSSRWATPIIDVDGEEIECWRWTTEADSNDKGFDGYWNEKARVILVSQ